MGPLFAFGFVAILGATSVTIVFVVAKLFLKFWPAVWLALATTAAGWITLGVMLVAQAPFYPDTLTGNQPETYLGTAAVVAALAAIAAGWITARAHRRR